MSDAEDGEVFEAEEFIEAQELVDETDIVQNPETEAHVMDIHKSEHHNHSESIAAHANSFVESTQQTESENESQPRGIWTLDLSLPCSVVIESRADEWWPLYHGQSHPTRPIATSSNFIKHGKWSPDGTCLLTSSEDNCLRLFEMPSMFEDGKVSDWAPTLRVTEGDSLYDFAWYPKMSSSEPNSCFFISTSRGHPIHAWDAFTGELKCSYNAFDHMDELASAICVSFNHDGSKIYCGFDKMIRVFDTNRPGRDHTNIPTTQHTGKRRQHIGQKGAISCLAFSPDNSKLFAAGSYSKTIGLYSEDQRNLVWMETASEGGVSQVQFSYDGTYLYSAGRKDSKILCWDIRNTGDIVYTMDRVAPTNQHIHFEIDSSGTQLVAASQDGIVRVYDLLRSGELIAEINTFEKSLNTVSLHPLYGFAAFLFGSREFDDFTDMEESAADNVPISVRPSRTKLQLWKSHMKWIPYV